MRFEYLMLQYSFAGKLLDRCLCLLGLGDRVSGVGVQMQLKLKLLPSSIAAGVVRPHRPSVRVGGGNVSVSV